MRYREDRMGTWGTALFSDDTACDVRDAYRALLADGYSGPKATTKLLSDWKDELVDEDDGPIFWLALAATQWQCGRLETRVKAKALKILDNESSLARWSEAGSAKILKQRRATLEKLRVQLLSPQPAAKTLRKPRRDSCPWEVGDVLAYRLRSRRYVLLHIVNPGQGSLAGNAPIFAVFDWIGHTPPDAAVIERLPLKTLPRGPDVYEFATVGPKSKDLAERLTSLGVKRKPHRQVTGGFAAFLWKDLDRELKERFGWK
jgi:hypothetical protein